MSTSIRITNTDSHASEPVIVQVWKSARDLPNPAAPISEHALRPGETLALAVRADQRIVVIEPAPRFIDALARYREATSTKGEQSCPSL